LIERVYNFLEIKWWSSCEESHTVSYCSSVAYSFVHDTSQYRRLVLLKRPDDEESVMEEPEQVGRNNSLR
jgi:hypothetical protein